MTNDEIKLRLDELTRTLAFANALGARAEVMGSKEEAARAKQIYQEAMAEIKRLESTP